MLPSCYHRVDSGNAGAGRCVAARAELQDARCNSELQMADRSHRRTDHCRMKQPSWWAEGTLSPVNAGLAQAMGRSGLLWCLTSGGVWVGGDISERFRSACSVPCCNMRIKLP